MAIQYYMDVHIPAAITEGLRQRQINVLTSQEDETDEADDTHLLQRATELCRLLYSQDQDLLRIAHEWQAAERTFSGLVFSHQQDGSIGRLIGDLELLAQCYIEQEVANRVLYLPLR